MGDKDKEELQMKMNESIWIALNLVKTSQNAHMMWIAELQMEMNEKDELIEEMAAEIGSLKERVAKLENRPMARMDPFLAGGRKPARRL